MKYEVGIVQIATNGTYAMKRGEPVISDIICSCNNIEDAMLVAQNNDCNGYFSVIRNDTNNHWFKYVEYPINKIENLHFETKQFTSNYCEAMLNKINEIIDYINKHE